MKTFGGHDFSFGVLRKVALEWLTGGEGGYEYPWQQDQEILGQLGLPPGVTWGEGQTGTLRWTYVPYELGVGLAADVNGKPGTFFASRYYPVFVDATDGLPFTLTHPLGVFTPHVQMVERIVGVTDTWRLYDIHGEGGTIDFIEDFATLSIDPGRAWQGYVVLDG